MAKVFTMDDVPVLYEDNSVLVVVKPHNLPSQADSSGDLDLLTLLKNYIKDKYAKPGNVYLGLVHRLDRPTGGIMVFAKNSKAAERLCKQITDGEVTKQYLATVTGVPKERKAQLVNYLKKNALTNNVYVATFGDHDARRTYLRNAANVSRPIKPCKSAIGYRAQSSDTRTVCRNRLPRVRRCALRRRHNGQGAQPCAVGVQIGI